MNSNEDPNVDDLVNVVKHYGKVKHFSITSSEITLPCNIIA